MKKEENIENNDVVIDDNEVAREREIVLGFIGEKEKKEELPVKSTPSQKDSPKVNRNKNEKKIGANKERNSIRREGKTKKILVHGLVSSIVLFVCLYSSFAFLVICFRVDNDYFRSVSKILPVPALVSKDRFVGYYQYKDLVGDGFQEDFATQRARFFSGKDFWSFID